MKAPKTGVPLTVYVNGRPQSAEGGLVRFPGLDAAKNNVLTLELSMKRQEN